MLTPLQLLRRVGALLRGRALDADMDEEVRFHLHMEEKDGLRRGLTPEESRRQARLAFGGVERFREEARDARGARVIRDFGADLRYAARLLRRTPVFTAVAVTTLGLGIGANTAIFSIVNAVILRPLPFPDTQSLVSVWSGAHSRAEFAGVRERTRTLSSVTAYQRGFGVSVGGEGEPLREVSALVGAEFFQVLGVTPAMGRFFRVGENEVGSEPVVVLAHTLWRDRFAADPDIVGQPVEIDGVSRTVVGVAPSDLSFPTRDTQLWIPLPMDPGSSGMHWGAYGYQLIGRLKPGVSTEQVRADVVRIAEALRTENPHWRPDSTTYLQGITVRDLHTQLVQDSRLLLFLLLSAVGLVLLLACANVANLLMLRGAARGRELAIRATLGAGGNRLARQLLAESMLLAAIGAASGVALATAGTGVLTRLLPAVTPRLDEVSVDGQALLFTMVLALVTGLGFGVLPARRAGTGVNISALAGARSGAGLGQRRLASALVSLQIAIAVVLAVGAGLLGRSFTHLLEVDPGFAVEQVSAARISPPRARYAEPDARRELAADVTRRLQATPGITAGALTSQLPFDQTSDGMAMWIDGWTVDPNRLDMFEMRYVTPDFFRTMGITLERGRAFNDADRADGRQVAIVSETAARRFWPGRDAVGGQVRRPWPGWLSVVGVVADVKNNDLRAEGLPALYVPYVQAPQFPVWAVVRAADPAAAQRAIRDAVAGAAPDVPVSDEQTLARLVERSVAAPRSASVMFLSFGALALLLGSVGTYGLVAYRVEARRREIAVRMAVGADHSRLIRLVLRDGLRLTVIGIAVGLVAAFGLSRLVRGLLFGIAPTDPLSFTIAPLLLGLTAIVACMIPALRATRVDPIAMLRRD